MAILLKDHPRRLALYMRDRGKMPVDAGPFCPAGARSIGDTLTLSPIRAIRPPVTELLMRGLLMALIALDFLGHAAAGGRVHLRFTKTAAKTTGKATTGKTV
jgi:hypothetical protein